VREHYRIREPGLKRGWPVRGAEWLRWDSQFIIILD